MNWKILICFVFCETRICWTNIIKRSLYNFFYELKIKCIHFIGWYHYACNLKYDLSSLIGSTGRNHDNGRMIGIERVGSFIKWHGNQITSAVNITMKWAWSLHVIIKWNRCHLQMSRISRIASLVFINIVFRRSEHFNFQLLKWQDRSK